MYIFFAVATVVLFIAGWRGVRLILFNPKSRAYDVHAGGAPGVPESSTFESADVTALSVALGPSARERVQAELSSLARGTGGELGTLCQAASKYLLTLEDEWIYGGAQNLTKTSSSEAERAFRRIATDMRTRYRSELIRGERGDVHEQQLLRPRVSSDEGAGVVVVTLVVAACYELADLSDEPSRAELSVGLKALSVISDRDLVALEVIWSPAADEDRMSSAELEALYPELHKLDPESRYGRVTCTSCGGVYAGELGRCPACGVQGPWRAG